MAAAALRLEEPGWITSTRTDQEPWRVGRATAIAGRIGEVLIRAGSRPPGGNNACLQWFQSRNLSSMPVLICMTSTQLIIVWLALQIPLGTLVGKCIKAGMLRPAW